MNITSLSKSTCLLLITILSPFVMAENYVMGQLVPIKSVTLSNEVTGIVDTFSKDIGDSVKQGEVLVKVSVVDNQLNVALSEAELAVSKNELEIQEKQLLRVESLYKKKGISASEFDEQRRITNVSRAQLEVDKIKLAMVKREQDKSQVKAPFSGFILTRSIELGQFVPTGDPLFTLVDMTQVKVRFYLLETDVVHTNVGDNVAVTIPSLEGKIFTGTVDIIAPAFQTNEPGFLVEVILANTSNELRPGMQARVQLSE